MGWLFYPCPWVLWRERKANWKLSKQLQWDCASQLTYSAAGKWSSGASSRWEGGIFLPPFILLPTPTPASTLWFVHVVSVLPCAFRELLFPEVWEVNSPECPRSSVFNNITTIAVVIIIIMSKTQTHVQQCLLYGSQFWYFPSCSLEISDGQSNLGRSMALDGFHIDHGELPTTVGGIPLGTFVNL